jgi:hypothetical protein
VLDIVIQGGGHVPVSTYAGTPVAQGRPRR